MQYDPWLLAAVPVTGFAAGFINTLAGSGSLITLPVLILLGLPANVANGTNRVGVLLQNIVAVETFRRHDSLDAAGSWRLILAALLGAVVGAALAVNVDAALLKRIIGALMLVMLVVVLWRPNRWLQAHAAQRRAHAWIQVPLFFAIGAYGGFIQAGVGVFLLAGLVLSAGYDLVGANAIKNLTVLVFTVAALAVFAVNGQVRWELGLLLGCGNALGAWVAARLAVRRGAEFVRWALILILLAAAIALIGDIGLPG
jgi:uncharacterized membrane protein YfcA